MKHFWRTLGLLLLLGIIAAVVFWPKRPPRIDYQAELFQGVTYTRQARSTPRPLMVHIVRIDLTTAGIDFLVTPGDASSEMDLDARTTSGFLRTFDVQLAINGGFFEPFNAGGLWDYYPHRGDPVNVMGLAISDGDRYSDDYPDMPVLCITSESVEVRTDGCALGTSQALAGNLLLVNRGVNVTPGRNIVPNPRTAVALDAKNEIMWLIVVDGRQPGYSEGVTPFELAEILIELDAQMALNLDGGGSSTLVVASGRGSRILNAPIHTRVHMRQRPVANHLGVRALPRPRE
jgi:hypothetical protein